MKFQTKLESLIESAINVLIGYVVAVTFQIILFPYFGINIPVSQNLIIGFWFTLISVIRSFLIRRFFNYRLKKKNLM